MIKEFTGKDIFIIMTPEGWYACFLPGVLYYIRHIKELNNITICKAKKLLRNSKKQKVFVTGEKIDLKLLKIFALNEVYILKETISFPDGSYYTAKYEAVNIQGKEKLINQEALFTARWEWINTGRNHKKHTVNSFPYRHNRKSYKSLYLTRTDRKNREREYRSGRGRRSTGWKERKQKHQYDSAKKKATTIKPLRRWDYLKTEGWM